MNAITWQEVVRAFQYFAMFGWCIAIAIAGLIKSKSISRKNFPGKWFYWHSQIYVGIAGIVFFVAYLVAPEQVTLFFQGLGAYLSQPAFQV